MTRPRVVLADDLAPVLMEVAALLKQTFDVVGIASDGRSALETTLRLKPDVVVLDISMPGLSGIEVARELRIRGSGAKIVFLTVYEDQTILDACHAAGGLGYVIKVLMEMDLIPAMKEALADRNFTSSFPSRANGS